MEKIKKVNVGGIKLPPLTMEVRLTPFKDKLGYLLILHTKTQLG